MRYVSQVPHHFLDSKYYDVAVGPQVWLPEILPSESSWSPEARSKCCQSGVQDQPPIQFNPVCLKALPGRRKDLQKSDQNKYTSYEESERIDVWNLQSVRRRSRYPLICDWRHCWSFRLHPVFRGLWGRWRSGRQWRARRAGRRGGVLASRRAGRWLKGRRQPHLSKGHVWITHPRTMYCTYCTGFLLVQNIVVATLDKIPLELSLWSV